MGGMGGVGSVSRAWQESAAALGSDAAEAERSGLELELAYAAPGRSYHTAAHIRQVLDDASWLAAELRVQPLERAVIAAAACAHDVVYSGTAGEDERASAQWARQALGAAGVADQFCQRVADLILATAEHTANEQDVGAWVLLDSDLAVLGQQPADYWRYVSAVRQEYRAVSDPDWRVGRSSVLRALRDRGSIYHLPPARARWEEQAQMNLAAELKALQDGVR